MKMYLNGDDDDEPKANSKPVGFDTLTSLVVPALSLLASIVALLKDQRMLAWGLIIMFLVSLASSFYSQVASRVKRATERTQDNRTARIAAPIFRKLLRKFEYFVGYGAGQANGPLYEIAMSEICSRNGTTFQVLHMAPTDLVRDLCYWVDRRLARQPSTLGDLSDSLTELNLMISFYCNNCVSPIFERFPQDLRPLLTERARSSLEDFREQFASFIDDYVDCLKDFDESLSKPVIKGYYFARPKPL